MAKEVLLMADVPGLGVEGEVVTVADGYARNYLLPRKLAAPVTEATRRRLAKIREEREEARRSAVAEAAATAEKLAGVSCTIAVRTADEDKLYGSVTAADIAEALKEQGIEIDRQALVMESPIKELGIFEIKVRLNPEVESMLKVWVVEE
jgi:large subunit ribosomal protein L9